MLTASHILVAFAVFSGWLLSLWVHPFGKCPRCRGERVVIKGSKRKPNPKRPPKPVQCKRCRGIGRRQRPGSRTLHRTVRRIRRELDRQRNQRRAAASEER
jgi:hypothetical protein